MNDHNPPTEAEVRATLWKRNAELSSRIDDLREQRSDLCDMLAAMIHASDYGGAERDQVKQRANRLLESIRDTIETE